MSAQVVERWRQLRKRPRAATVTHHSTARAEAAVDGTAVRREQQRAIGVTLHQRVSNLMCFFAEWVTLITGRLHALFNSRHDLPSDRATRVRAHQGAVVGRARNGKPAGFGTPRTFELVRIELQGLRQLSGAGQRVLKLPNPIVEALTRHLGERQLGGHQGFAPSVARGAEVAWGAGSDDRVGTGALVGGTSCDGAASGVLASWVSASSLMLTGMLFCKRSINSASALRKCS